MRVWLWTGCCELFAKLEQTCHSFFATILRRFRPLPGTGSPGGWGFGTGPPCPASTPGTAADAQSVGRRLSGMAAPASESPHRVVVEIGRRGKLVVGEPYFTPGVPIVLESRGTGDLGPGDLAVVRPGRGRAKVERRLGSARRIENVLEALLVEHGARVDFEPYTLPAATEEGRVDLRDLTTFTVDPETAKDFDDALSFRREPDGIRAW